MTALSREHQSAMAGVRMKSLQNLHRLLRQRYKVSIAGLLPSLAPLHTRRRDCPKRAFKVHFCPGRGPQLARSLKQQWCQLERSANHWSTVVRVDRTQKYAQLFGISDRSEVLSTIG